MSEDRKNLVDRVLGISSWKQAFITVMLGFFVLIAWLAYTNSARLVEVFEGFMREKPEVKVDEKLVPGIIEALLSVPHVRSVSIWSIDYESNRRWILGSGANTEVAKAWMEKHLVALRGGYPVLRMIPNANMHIIKAINGQLGCGPLEGPLDEIAALEAVGIVWDCTVGIPPEAGRLVGAIYVGFSEALSDAQLDALRAPLWSAAQKLVKQ